MLQRRRPAFFAQHAHVFVPIAALDGDVRNQMMQIGFVNHHHARMLQRHLVTKIVIGVIANLIEDHIERSRVELRWLGRKNLYVR